MSGICGIIDFEAARVEPTLLRRLAEFSSYRGQGGIEYYCVGEAGLAHLTRNAGEVGAGQHVVSADQKVYVILDGRFDNRADLIALLRPVEGSSASDASLLLAAYLRWGEACASQILGDFAFALWDTSRRRLVCSVDSLGLKPLYYTRLGSLLIFASDALQVLQHPAVPKGYNEQEIAAYLTSRIEHPERSFFRSVCRLAPAQQIVFTQATFEVKRYWHPSPCEIVYSQDEDYAEHFRELLRRAVTDRLRTEGDSVGVAMSGGLDSTSIAAVAHHSRNETAKNINAYTFVFDLLSDCDEQAWSRTMTKELGLATDRIHAENFWGLETAVPLPYSPDSPILGWRPCYQEVFRRMAERGSRVLLMGHGGDDLVRGSILVYLERLRRGDLGAIREVFAQAQTHREPRARAAYRYFGRPLLPSGIDRLLLKIFGGRKEAAIPVWIRPEFVRAARVAERQKGLQPCRVFASPARHEVYSNLVSTPWYWRQANWHDRNAASYGIEVRHPFLDRRLFEFVLAIPSDQLFRLGTTKSLLRRAMKGILPETVRTRPGKTRFTSFLELTLRERAAGEIQELLTAPVSADLGIVEKGRLQSAYRNFQAGVKEDVRSLWYTITVEIWLRRCKALLRGDHLIPSSRIFA